MLCEGQQQATALGYSPLPLNLVLAGSEQIKKIPGAGSTGVDVNSCNNPTFKAGDSPGNNLLAQTAPAPANCDQKGPNQCTTGTAGATTSTAITGTGTGGSASGLAAGGTSGLAAGGTSGAAATASGSGAVYDENGAVVAGGTTSGVGAAVSSPFTVADTGFGPQQWVMAGAGALLIASIILPPLFSRRLKRPGGPPTR